MRNAKLAMLVLLAAGAATIAGPTPAAAIDYPYCIQGRGWGVPGDCSYRSYAQCMAAASGRGSIATSIPASRSAGSGAGGPIGIIEARTQAQSLVVPANAGTTHGEIFVLAAAA